jgi:hypothetical protein
MPRAADDQRNGLIDSIHKRDGCRPLRGLTAPLGNRSPPLHAASIGEWPKEKVVRYPLWTGPPRMAAPPTESAAG